MRRFLMLGALLVLVMGFSLAPVLADDVQSVRYFSGPDGARVWASDSGTGADTPFAIASVGKTMTAVAVLRQVAGGAVQLDAPAARWLPGDVVAGLGGMEGVTLRHLLTMTSGLPEYYTDDYVDDALADPGRVQRPPVAVSYAYGERRVFEPGAGFDYSNTNYLLLGVILERVTGRSYADTLRREVLGPAGMRDSFVFGSRALPDGFPNGHEDGRHVRDYYAAQGFGDGGVISTARDLARFYRALFVDQVLLPPEMLRVMLRDRAGVGYGMGIEVEDGIYGHSGGDLGFSADIRFDVGTGAVAVMLVAESDADTGWT